MLWQWAKNAVIFAAMVFGLLVVEYGDNCTSYRASWCDFLDASFAMVGL